MAIIFFDYDGVLVDSLEMESRNYIEALSQVGVEGIIHNSDDMAKLSEGNFFSGMLDKGVSQEKIDASLRVYKRVKEKASCQVKVHAEMLSLLQEVAKKYPVYIISSNISNTIEVLLQQHGIEGVCDILGADKEASKVAKLKKIMASHPGEKTLFIGDTKGDMLEAKEAGVDLRLGVTWGWQKPGVVAAGKPHYLFHCQRDCINWFHGFMAATK